MEEIVEIDDTSEDIEKRRKILIKLLQRYGAPIFDEFSTENHKEKAWNKILTKINSEGYNYNKETIKQLAEEFIHKCNCYKANDKQENNAEDAYLAINDVAVLQNTAGNSIYLNNANYAQLTGVGFEQTADVSGMSGCSCF